LPSESTLWGRADMPCRGKVALGRGGGSTLPLGGTLSGRANVPSRGKVGQEVRPGRGRPQSEGHLKIFSEVSRHDAGGGPSSP